MPPKFYSLSEVLEVANVHPFYSDAKYPPTREQIPAILKAARAKKSRLRLTSFPVTRKDSLYTNSHGLDRAIDLMTELFENAGASVLCAGPGMPHQAVMEALAEFRANAVAGDVSQLLQLASYLTTLDEEQRKQIVINKLIYTSESMNAFQRQFLVSAFGDVTICSVIGSAEAGPWGSPVLPFSVASKAAQPTSCALSCAEHVPFGHRGLLAQTSLQRLRNPLVRYLCGDVASLHPLSPELLAKLPSQYRPYYQLVRVYGRDQRSSFTWYGEYFDFKAVQSMMDHPQWNILQWQIILRDAQPKGAGIVLEVRVFRGLHIPEKHVSEEELALKIREFFWVFDFNQDLFHLSFVSESGGSCAAKRDAR
ncbi:hypothetical protein N7512_000002 [Penicillium capsulatum]|nr:hypothetical protein N7512_000002 [Penicillium capsulatum]